jgi:hypothetical protein
MSEKNTEEIGQGEARLLSEWGTWGQWGTTDDEMKMETDRRCRDSPPDLSSLSAPEALF